MKNLNQKIITLAVMASSALVVGTANADVPLAASTAITAVSTDGLAMVDLFWPVIGGLTAAFVLIKLFKRGASKI